MRGKIIFILDVRQLPPEAEGICISGEERDNE